MNTQNKFQGKVGFIGAGQMATALACGWLRGGVLQPDQITASDVSAEARVRFSQLTGGECKTNNLEVVEAADVIVVAVKPAQMTAVLTQIGTLGGSLVGERFWISIAAGIPIDSLLAFFPGEVRLARVMPNTSVKVCQGVCAYSLPPKAKPEDAALVQALFAPLGVCVRVEESQMDAVTALSGSGPAMVYLVIEALIDAAVAVGLPRSLAELLAIQTVRGAAEMAQETREHPAVLKSQVTSPGGTTIAGLKVLEERAVRAAFIAGVEAAVRRAKELFAATKN